MSSLSPVAVVSLSLAVVAGIGLASLLRTRLRVWEQLEFVAEYRHQLSTLIEDARRDTYEWLTLNATRMQSQLGSEGIVSIRPPHADYIVNHYAVVLNALSELRTYLSDELLSRSNLPRQYHALIEDALLRHEGTLNERARRNASALRNPVRWFAEGTQAVLASPLWLLESLGILPQRLAGRIRGSQLFAILSGGVAAVGFLSAVVGLVTGWEQFIVIAKQVMPSAF